MCRCKQYTWLVCHLSSRFLTLTVLYSSVSVAGSQLSPGNGDHRCSAATSTGFPDGLNHRCLCCFVLFFPCFFPCFCSVSRTRTRQRGTVHNPSPQLQAPPSPLVWPKRCGSTGHGFTLQPPGHGQRGNSCYLGLGEFGTLGCSKLEPSKLLLVGGLEHFLFFHILIIYDYIRNKNPNWLIFSEGWLNHQPDYFVFTFRIFHNIQTPLSALVPEVFADSFGIRSTARSECEKRWRKNFDARRLDPKRS